MPSPQPLLLMDREWPWALAVLADPETHEEFPDHLDQTGVAVSRSTVAAGIRHAVDGPARAEVWLGDAPTGLTCIHDGDFSTDSVDVMLFDAGLEQTLRATVGAGRRRLRVLVDDAEFPARLVFELTGHGLDLS